MPTHHFIASDCLTILAAFCLFSVVALLPGYAIGWLTDVLRFRSRTLEFRLAASVPLAIAIGPIISYSVGRWISLTAVLYIYGALTAYTLYLAIKGYKSKLLRFQAKKPFAILGLIAVWLLIAIALLADLQIGRRLYFSIIGFDYSVRIEFAQAISTFGVPAQNPFFFPGHEVVLRYHYFWIILCSLVHRMAFGLLDSRPVFIAGTMWCGIALIGLIPLYLRIFSPQGAANLYRRSVIGIALLGVTGLDILGALFMVLLFRIGLIRGISPSVEWWNNQVDGWIYTMLWEPHYLCALIACLTGFLVLWDVQPESGWRRRSISGVFAGLAFASAAGAGIYVAMVFAAFLSLWTLLTLAKRWYLETAMLAIAGFTAIAANNPYVKTLKTAKATGGRLLELTIRSFNPGELLMQALRLKQPWEIHAGNLLLLPLNYFLELGVFSVIGYMAWSTFRKQKRAPTRQELAAFLMAGTSILICTFVRSSVIANNDLGWRGFLIAQFILLLWGADLLSQPNAIPAPRRSFINLLLVLGIAGVAYDLAILRFFPLLSDAAMVPKIGWLARDEQLGRRTYANREAYEWLRSTTSPRAVIQQNHDVEIQDSFYGLYGQRQTMAADRNCGATFGGDPDECAPISTPLVKLFAGGSPESFDATCRSLPVDVFIAKDTDPAWRDRTSWVWKRPAAFANDFVRVFPCRSGSAIVRQDESGSDRRAAAHSLPEGGGQ